MGESGAETFARVLLRIYDRKLLNGETTFSRSGISKNDFTRLCIDPEYVPPAEAVEVMCEKMNITGEEREKLLSFVGE